MIGGGLLPHLSLDEPIGLLQVLDLLLTHLRFHCCVEVGVLVPVKRDKINCKPGTKYKAVSKIGKKTYTTDAVLLEYDLPYVAAVKGFTDQGEMTTRYILDEYRVDCHIVTALTVEAYIIPKNRFYKWMLKCFSWTSKAMMAEELEHLKNVLEDAE